MREPVIRFEKVCKSFGRNVVLRDVDLNIFEGEVTAIIGKSGAGKSVFLKHIIGLLKPDSGKIFFKGRSLSGMKRKELTELKNHFSYMFQNNALFDSLTVYENIALPLKEKTRMKPEEIQENVLKQTSQLEISDVLDKYPSQISGGMMKRVALARALITDPEIVLFDEPTTGLDPIRKNAVLNMIAQYQRRFGFTAVVVSHDIPDIFYIADQVAIIEDSTILFEGTPVELEQSEQPEVQAFLSSLETLKDELTGLDTRREFMVRFKRLREQIRLGERFGFILFTIKGLEEIDEHVGHIAAQHVIQSLSNDLIDQLGGRGRAVRVGKNEVAAYFPVTRPEEIDTFRKTMVQRLPGLSSLGEETNFPECSIFCIKVGTVEVDEYPDLQASAIMARDNEQDVVFPACKTKEAA